MVSVIITTYKRSDYICRAIDSVLNQSYHDVEVIVVDDNDSDSIDRNQMEIVMTAYKGDKRVKYIKHKKNMNGAAARNTGIKNSSGDYITFLDDDDFFLSDRINELVSTLEMHTDYDCAYTGLIKIENNKITGIYPPEYEGTQEEKLLNLYSFFRSGSNLFFKKSVFEKLKGFDTDFKRHQDVEFMSRFFQYYKIKAINNYSIIKDDSSRINQPNIKKSIEAKELFFTKFSDRLNLYNANKIMIDIYQSVLNQCETNSDEYIEIINKMKKLGCIKPQKTISTNPIIKAIREFGKKINIFFKSFKCKDSINEMKKIIKKYKRV